ncbi:hypothetical protein [Nocardioides mangrovi]|uniref:Uncharacterized protein n=1 Tax=Nocardioides mangrovi TaxID=2874580 RepID=A0ABS7UBD2_9ACTN|nr:hypothetical protein [Nocardioides mangrovi]MBZ5737998.1 hypothetical protein [Nocardioides mangrovi]
MTTVFAVIGALALLVLTAAAVCVAAAAVVARRRLRELRHLPDLGRRFETRHEAGHITEITKQGDRISILVDSADVSTTVLDEQGTPDHVGPSHPERSRWQVSGLSVDHLARLAGTAEAHGDVRVVSTGVVGIAGPVTAEWRLETADGMVLTARG